MVFKQVLKRNEYLSECGRYKVVESKYPGYWWPMKKSGENGTSFIRLVYQPLGFNDAKDICIYG